MAQVINSTDYLTFILTQYGLNRVGEALANPNEDLNISKIKVGDANFTYYEPTEAQTELVHLIPDGDFYIIEKELLEDNLTVSFHAIFPETFQNAEIREVGIYETIDGVDYLFAVSTQQPLLKPYMDLNYLISVDYYAFLKAQNLAEVYDQIVLNPDNQLVSGEDLENLMSTILFTEDNLMDQIHDNTKILGLNRVQQLQEKMDKDKSDFGYVASYNNYVTLLDYLDSSSKVLGYWLFNYPRRISPSASIIDIGPNGYNFSTNTVSNSYLRVFNGIMPMLSFTNGYFYLEDNEGVLDFYNPLTEEDISFSMLFAVEPHDWTTTRTLLARSNYSSGAGGTHVFEVNELPNKSLEVKFFTDNSNYITYTSEANIIPDKAHSVLISYDATSLLNKLTVYVSAKETDITETTTGTFTNLCRGTALPLTSFITSANGTNAQLINSNVGVVSIIKKALTKEEMRSISLTLEATMGNNPCLQTY